MSARVINGHSFEGEILQRQEHSAFESTRICLIDSLSSSLEGRFTDVDEDVLNATQITNIKSWPDKAYNDGTYLFP